MVGRRVIASGKAAGLLLLFLLATVACSAEAPGGPAAAALQPLAVCVSSSSINRAGIDYALEHGLFEKHGLAVTLLDLSGGTTAATALIAGEAEICEVSGPAVVNAALAGVDLQIIAGVINQQLYSLLVDPEIKMVEDLRGKALAVSEPGSSSDTILRYGLSQAGLEPDRDVIIVAVGGNSQRVAALQAGSVAGTVVSLPESIRAEALGFPVLLSPDDINPPYQHTSIVASRDFLAENRQVAVNYVKALAEATFLMKRDREGTLDVVAETLLLDRQADAAFLNEAYEQVILNTMDEALVPNREGVAWLIELGRLENPSALDLTVDDVVDMSVTDELASSGFLDSLGE